jgi:glucose-1-phosphate cytidylyltransferase
MDVDNNGVVTQFREKPVMDGWVNAGFFIFEGSIEEYLDSECVLEQDPLARLAQEGELAAYRHHGFWQPMDTLRESVFLNELWSADKAPWKIW